MGDFQYLVPKDDRMRQTREAILKGDGKRIESCATLVDSLNNVILVQKIRDFRPRTSAEEGPDLHSVPPPLFSLRDAPFNYGYVV